MVGNKLSGALGTDVFSSKNLIHLQEVSLTRCDIQRLHKFSLRNLTNLIKLNLADNQIRFIPGYAFSCVPELRYVNFFKNKLKSLKVAKDKKLANGSVNGDVDGCVDGGMVI